MKLPRRPTAPRPIGLSAAPLLALCLAACGGGGSDATGTIGPIAAGGTTPAPTSTSTAGSTCNIPDFAATALARVNQLRAAGADCRSGGTFAPAAALTWSALLTRAAETHTQDMAAKNFFSHTGSSGSTLADRVGATGYAWSSLGENIAAGYAGIDKVVDGWIASDGHCANLMNPGFNQAGMVCVPGDTASSYRTYWTLDLARSR